MLLTNEGELWGTVALSLRLSLGATLIAALFAVPLGFLLAVRDFRSKSFVTGLLRTLLAVPAVFLGVVVYLLLSRKGLLGPLGLLFTPWAILIAQALLAFPLVCALTYTALQGIARESLDLAHSFGADRLQTVLLLLRQGRTAFLTALITGFSRVLGETGMTLMVGGNLKGETRVMTTAISLETMKGNFEIGLALGLVLVILALGLNLLLQLWEGYSFRRRVSDEDRTGENRPSCRETMADEGTLLPLPRGGDQRSPRTQRSREDDTPPPGRDSGQALGGRGSSRRSLPLESHQE